MSADPHLIGSLEQKVRDLESKVAALEHALGRFATEARASDDVQLPQDVVERISEGENTVRVLRQYRYLTQKELSERSGIRANHISAIERGLPYGLKTAKRLAGALDVPLGLLA
ncbi:MAG: helix-turn-helix transcriptional regulator [Hyphomonas sp.]|nr:helix-turn-helix transcriptional regulator [Hyphomonas sp.]MCB9962841.1 helix-turn-helix transcriptional regulator [Hyphomonas sp.]